MYLPEDDSLDIGRFSAMFNDMSESYKLFWFQSIMELIDTNRNVLTFDEIIDRMIVNAWYMVTEYRLNLGPSDAIEKCVLRLHDISGLQSNVKENEIKEYLRGCDDKDILNLKRTLTLNVPYRLHSPFLKEADAGFWKQQSTVVRERINSDDQLLYAFGEEKGLNRTIHIRDEWLQYLLRNRAIIFGWIEAKQIRYLQRRNPGIPGLADKLKAPVARNLQKATKFWLAVMQETEVPNIYDLNRSAMTKENFTLDHFIPWSYVAHDELWNLIPTTRELNSSKSNDLPVWDTFFPLFGKAQYDAYRIMENSYQVQQLFQDFQTELVASKEAFMSLYSDGDLSENDFCTRLNNMLYPTWSSAKAQGFRIWDNV